MSKWLKKQRDFYGLTQQELANMINCSSNHYAMVERGDRKLTPKFARKLAYYYGLTVQEVLKHK